MALTITYDGYGVVANADRETNDTGGTIGFNPDTYLFEGGADGAGGMGSNYASKIVYFTVYLTRQINFKTQR